MIKYVSNQLVSNVINMQHSPKYDEVVCMNDYFSLDSIPTEQTVTYFRTVYYSNPEDMEAAEDLAEAAYNFYLENDDKHTLRTTKNELENLRSKFPTSKKIAENYAGCLSAWVYGKSTRTIENVKGEILLMRQAFPDSADIAWEYTNILESLARAETSIEICNTYLREISEIIHQFPDKAFIKSNYKTIEQRIDSLHEYWAAFQQAKSNSEIYKNTPCIDIAIEYAIALNDLACIEEDENKCQEYTDVINSLVKKYPNCIELIELQTGAMYYLAATQGYDDMRKASASIRRMLKKYPLNEAIAENYVLTLDYLSEDEENTEKLVRDIRAYHELYPSNSTITTSYAAVLSVLVDSQSLSNMEDTLDLIWNLFIHNTNLEDICNFYKDAFNRYRYNKALTNEREKIFALPFGYSSWLEKSVMQIDKSTGEIVREYKTVIDACRDAKITPVEMLKSISENVYSDNQYNWIVVQ